VSTEYLLTTVLVFADRAEGQVLHRGTRDDCKSLSDMMPAIITSGEAPIEARHLIVETANFSDLAVGQTWRCARPEVVTT
jgi:hypothetical protein